MNQYKLGTRRSLLAWAQSSWVAREIERLNPGTQVELVGIDTRGDKIQDVSLRNIEGKEFFVAELDEALASASVDLTVHSMKDLSLERPAAFVRAAIPRRENPRDVVLFGPGVMERLRAGKKLRVGTSSPRRIENIPAFLEHALPQVGPGLNGRPELEFVEIRGNVNTRLGRVHEAAGNERHLDAVVLAFAGLIRLWRDERGREELSKLLQGVRWMVLPLRECPAAPAQGALAVECRASASERDQQVRAAVARLHDPGAEAQVAAERQLLADWGGGCHQRFGATALDQREVGQLLFVRGAKSTGEIVDELRWSRPATLAGARVEAAVWDGGLWRGRIEKSVDPRTEPVGFSVKPLEQAQAVFIAHARALPSAVTLSARVWTSGTSSWFSLARQGVWVEGCAESLGYDQLGSTLKEGVLQLPDPQGTGWAILTHEAAREGWGKAQVVPTYRLPSNAAQSQELKEAQKALQQAQFVFWSSGSQYDALKDFIKNDSSIRHFCGAGKTAAHLRERGVNPTVFPSIEEWRKWLRT